MPNLPYQATNFPGTYGPALQGQNTLEITWPELIWAAISVGRAELLHLLRFGAFSRFEIVYRAALIFANLKELPDGNIGRSEAYDGLDPSEKGAVSYFLGLTVTKLIADRLLNVPWLMHLDVYRATVQPVTQAGGARPDLVGQTAAGEWVAMEAKGRTNGRDQAALDRAKEQVEALVSVGGVPPILRVASQAHFEGGTLHCTLNDPEERRPKPTVEVPLSREKLVEGYYRPFREWLKELPDAGHRHLDGREYRIATLPDVDLTIGLEEVLLVEASPQSTGVENRNHIANERTARGKDGILVDAGDLWMSTNMRLEPQERRRTV